MANTKMDALRKVDRDFRNKRRSLKGTPAARDVAFLGRDVEKGGPQPNPRERQIVSSLQAKGGLGQMLAAQGADAKTLKDVEEIEAMPGGMELLYTVAAEDLLKGAGVPKKDAKKIRLYCYGGLVERAYARGGDVKAAAETTRRAGRGDDSMMLHVSPDEYDVIEKMWGKAEINPNTGIGEYGFLSRAWKKVKKTVKRIAKSQIFQIVAPIALSIFVPGLGAAIGGMLGASGTAASVVGNALIQGGLSAAGGGDFVKGALTGAITGGLGDVAGGMVQKVAPGMSDATAAIAGSALAGGTAAELTGGEFVSGAIQGGLTQAVLKPAMEGITSKGQEMLGIQDPAGGGILAERTPVTLEEIDLADYGSPERIGAAALPDAAAATADAVAAAAAQPGVAPAPDVTPPGKEGINLMDYALPAAMLAGGMGGGGGEEYAEPELPPDFLQNLPVYNMDREFQGLGGEEEYYTYGQQGAPQSGQHLFTSPDPFAGETGTPTVGPGPAGGLGGSDPVAQMIAAGQVVPAAMVGMSGVKLQQAGYTQDPNTGDWTPPQQLGLGLPQARGGYQRGGQYDYWSQNADVPRVAPSVAASGRYVKGEGTGRSDDIPARLSDGEYVIDAESVALLGDGSGDAGARQLDEMRKNLRQHKAKNLGKGGFSHKAKQPHQYMAAFGGMAKLRRAMTEAGRA